MRTAATILTSVMLVTAGAAAAQQAGERQAKPQIDRNAPHTAIIDRNGRQIGAAVFQQTPNGVLVSVQAQGLPPGEHGFHIHQTGQCDPKTGFKSAGDHFAPRGNQHGYEVAGGPHAGDMPNQFVSADGRLRAHAFNPNLTLRGGPNALLDQDGSALVIHAQPDDYSSQPSGNAGDRLACAAIRPTGR